ncbi:MAG: J domain-containing protein [Candidatus Dormibacteria bacterium]
MPLRSPAPAKIDVYSVLGADRGTPWQELRQRYRARARELHPDAQVHRQGPQRLDQQRATALFARLQAAWALVATPELRADYDRASRPEPALARRTARRPTRVPPWEAGPRAAVLLRAGPGDLHIAIPGGDWDLSLAAYSGLVQRGRAPGLLIGDIPPHPVVRNALGGLAFVERHRLTTMVGLVDPAVEHHDPADASDDSGIWKVDQLGRAWRHWSRAQPARRPDHPYADDLLLMGRLSLAGYQLNLPHPAGLLACSEPGPVTRLEAQERKRQATLEIRLPPPTLLLTAFWSGDQRLMLEVARTMSADTGILAGTGGPAAVALRSVAGKRARADHHDPVWGSVLDRPAALPESLSGLSNFTAAWEWLTERRQLPDRLPWGVPLSLSGRDQALSDAGARLTARLVARVLEVAPPGSRMISLQGTTVRLRLEEEEARAAARALGQGVADEVEALVGWRVEPTVL